jgi:hypothetical protein
MTDRRMYMKPPAWMQNRKCEPMPNCRREGCGQSGGGQITDYQLLKGTSEYFGLNIRFL